MRVMLKICAIVQMLTLVSCSNSSGFSGGTELSSESAPQNTSSQFDPERSDYIRKGSFTVWTHPTDPLPGQAYTVHLEVEVYDPSNSYNCRNLSGDLHGTDGYRFSIDGACQKNKDFAVKSFHGGAREISRHQFQFRIPGGSRRVVDILKIQSRPITATQNFTTDAQSIEIEF